MLTSVGLAEREGYLTVKEVATLKELALLLKSNPKAVNVGSGMGVSGLAFMESRPDLYLYSIDIEADSTLGSLAMEQKAFEEAGIWGSNRYLQILGDSRKIGLEWVARGFKMVDIVFIDDGHTYEEVVGDIKAWRSNLSQGGIMAFHDYRNKFDIGVSRAVDELMIGCERVAWKDSLIAFRIGKVRYDSKLRGQ